MGRVISGFVAGIVGLGLICLMRTCRSPGTSCAEWDYLGRELWRPHAQGL